MMIVHCRASLLHTHAPPYKLLRLHAEQERGRLIVETAAVGEGVLGGIMRLHVLEACAALGVPVCEAAADLQCAHTWRAAFFTNW